MNYQSVSRVGTTIRIAKLILQESGTYNPMFSRPYQTHVTNETLSNITRRVEDARGTKVTGALFAGAASEMITPSATPGGVIPIPMGWSDRRIRFMMEVNVVTSSGSEMIYYFQGYTSHLGVGSQGSVDPQMDFILNSYVRVSRTLMQTPYGSTMRDTITETAHIVNGSIVNQVSDVGVYTMRPQDIFIGIQNGYLENAYSTMPNGGSLNDTRIKMTGDSLRSNRSNNLASSFIAKVVDSYQTGKQLLDFGQGDNDIYGRCHSITAEPSAYENIFIRALSNVKGTHCTTTFKYEDLRSIDPNIDNVTKYLTLGNTAMTQLHQAGQTAHWSGTDRETLAATILSNAIPAIMMDLMLTKVYFRATNHDIGGLINTVIIDVASFTNADLTPNLEMFKHRLDKEVLFDLTYGNQFMFTLEMNVDLFGETRITLQFDSSPAVSYTTPSFCDSLLTPIITMNKDNFFGVVHDFEVLMNNLPNDNKAMSFNPIV